jgi:hypothetical protein
MKVMQDICDYWCKSMPENSEQFEVLRGILKSQYVKVADKAAEYNYSFIHEVVCQARNFAQVCAEFDKKLEEYIDTLANACRTLLNIAEAL